MERYAPTELKIWTAWESEFGPVTLHERIDINFAIHDWLFANANRNSKKRRRPFELEKFERRWSVSTTPPKKKLSEKPIGRKDAKRGYLGRGEEILKKFAGFFNMKVN